MEYPTYTLDLEAEILYSKRHHYIPKFFIKGFTNEQNFIWIYDIEKDKIYSKHPNNIFYKDYYNSISILGRKMAIIESLYNGIGSGMGADKSFPQYIKQCQYNDNVNLNDISIVGSLIYFIAQLTYRVPANEEINNNIVERIARVNPEYYEFLIHYHKFKPDRDDYYKLARYYTPTLILNNYKDYSDQTFFTGIRKHKRDVFCLSDNPVIWNKYPDGITQYFHESLVLPITKNKLVYIGEKGEYNYNEDIFNDIINISMLQANKYFGFSDRDRLLKYVNIYRDKKQIGKDGLQLLKSELFKKMKGDTKL